MHMGSLESTQGAASRTIPTLLSCSIIFPRESINQYTYVKHESILKKNTYVAFAITVLYLGEIEKLNIYSEH